jgi:hypothetical protein
MLVKGNYNVFLRSISKYFILKLFIDIHQVSWIISIVFFFCALITPWFDNNTDFELLV